jgi:hypothetical protein
VMERRRSGECQYISNRPLVELLDPTGTHRTPHAHQYPQPPRRHSTPRPPPPAPAPARAQQLQHRHQPTDAYPRAQSLSAQRLLVRRYRVREPWLLLIDGVDDTTTVRDRSLSYLVMTPPVRTARKVPPTQGPSKSRTVRERPGSAWLGLGGWVEVWTLSAQPRGKFTSVAISSYWAAIAPPDTLCEQAARLCALYSPVSTTSNTFINPPLINIHNGRGKVSNTKSSEE